LSADAVRRRRGGRTYHQRVTGPGRLIIKRKQTGKIKRGERKKGKEDTH